MKTQKLNLLLPVDVISILFLTFPSEKAEQAVYFLAKLIGTKNATDSQINLI